MKHLVLIVLLFSLSFARANNPAPVLYDTIYHADIASVTAYVAGLPLSLPVMELNGGASISISFDDLRSGTHRYKYELVHCNMNWVKDDLDEYDYIDGFNRSEIRNYHFSTNRNLDYTHYQMELPNNDVKLKISGNYVIHIYEEPRRGQRIYLFSRRLLLLDPKVKIHPSFARPTDAIKYRSHQEIDFEISNKGFPIYNSRQEISCTVLQNGRWNMAISDIKQNRDKPERLVFDYFDKVVFSAGKEFRYFDIRSLLFRSRFVKKIEETRDDIYILLEDDKTRDLLNFIDDKDANGKFLLDNADLPDPTISSEYVWVDFSLRAPEMTDQKIYVIGAFSDWQCKEPNLMKFDLESQKYKGSIQLKQGYYNYKYVSQDLYGNSTSSALDGDWYETENEYTILVYYRPFGSRYDQLIALHSFKP